MTHPTESLRTERFTIRRGPCRTRLVLTGLALAGLLAGCTSVVTGSGSTNLTSAPPTQVVPTPTPTGGAAGAPTACPRVAFPAAKLTFDCLSPDMTESTTDQVWPLAVYKTVEPSTGWVYEEGAGHWGPAEGHSLTAITENVRQQMIDSESYGTSPKVSTFANKNIDVDTTTGHLLQTMVTLDPSWAKVERTKVRREQLWIVAIKVGADDFSLWYASIPDLAKSLWPKVPALINGIRVG